MKVLYRFKVSTIIFSKLKCIIISIRIYDYNRLYMYMYVYILYTVHILKA